MSNLLSAEEYGLPKRVQLIQMDINTIGIIKKRKSRIIMKDTAQIINIANHILEKDNGVKIALLISGPICSKSRKYLIEHSIDVVSD